MERSSNHVSKLEKIVRKPNQNKLLPLEIISQWHPTENGKWKATDFSRGSNYYATFYCGKIESCGCHHIWISSISNRIKRGCPWCCGQIRCEHMMNDIYSLQAKFPEISKEWHPTKNNGITPNQITACSAENIWWLCPNTCPQGCVHEYQMIVSNKTLHKQGCPFSGCCSVAKKCCIHTSIKSTHPEIAKYWDDTENKDDMGNILLSENFTYGSKHEVHWICPEVCPEGCIHKWTSLINSSTRSKDKEFCPFCSGQKICEHTSLQAKYPEIAKEWHPTKNIDDSGNIIKINKIFSVTHLYAWWLCPNKCPYGCVHEYQMNVSNRTKHDQGCPFSGCCKTAPKKCCLHTSLQFLFPELSSEWHPTKNTLKPYEVLPYSNICVWWKCKKDKEEHEWESCISDRHNNGCPYCQNYKAEKETRKIAENITGKLFPKKKSIFENNRWEIDCYNKELKIGIEQQGIQHYEFKHHFHRNGIIDFEKQQKTDESKRQQCKNLGIYLIEVSYLLVGKEKEEYIKNMLEFAYKAQNIIQNF